MYRAVRIGGADLCGAGLCLDRARSLSSPRSACHPRRALSATSARCRGRRSASPTAASSIGSTTCETVHRPRARQA